MKKQASNIKWTHLSNKRIEWKCDIAAYNLGSDPAKDKFSILYFIGSYTVNTVMINRVLNKGICDRNCDRNVLV